MLLYQVYQVVDILSSYLKVEINKIYVNLQNLRQERRNTSIYSVTKQTSKGSLAMPYKYHQSSKLFSNNPSP
jgi:hypothetical protein